MICVRTAQYSDYNLIFKLQTLSNVDHINFSAPIEFKLNHIFMLVFFAYVKHRSDEDDDAAVINVRHIPANV